MAFVINPGKMEPGNTTLSTNTYSPGTATPFSGIYRCASCGWEAASVKGHPLPPQNVKHGHPTMPIRWQIVVAAKHEHV